MSERQSAEILAFPQTAPTRLKRAIEGLEKALADQKTAVVEWQRTLRDLRESMGDLRSTLVGYDVALKRLSVNVTGLNAESRRLEAWADETIARDESARPAAETARAAATRERAIP